MDILLYSLTLNGDTNFVEYLGQNLNEYGVDIVYNSISDRIVGFGTTDSTNFNRSGGIDILAF
jgi:hypothetical protein